MSKLSKFLERWIETNKTNARWLSQDSGVKQSTLHYIMRKDVQPRPDTLQKLATSMGVSPRLLLQLAGHVTEEDLEPSLVSSDDQELLGLWHRIPDGDRPLLRRIMEAAATYRARPAQDSQEATSADGQGDQG